MNPQIVTLPRLGAVEVCGTYNAPQSAGDTPLLDAVRGACPFCGSVLVSNRYYLPNRGFLTLWQCWKSFPCADAEPTCAYRRVI